MSEGGDVEIMSVVCNTQSANVRDNVFLCTVVSALISPVVSGEEDAPGGHDGVAPPPDHGDAGPGHWV